MPKSAKINLSMQEIEQDISTAYAEMDTLGRSFVEVFNYSTALHNELDSSAQRVTSQVVDLKILSDQFDQNVLVAGDDFTDMSRVDTNATVQNPRADVAIGQGIVTLQKVSSEDVARNGVDITVRPVNPNDLQPVPTVDNINRFYEGNFYDFTDSARPEGGMWHLEESLSKELAETGITNRTYTSAAPGRHPFLLQQYLDAEGPGGGSRLSPEDIVVYDRGASEEEKKSIRALMVDGNPSTFWECEYIKTYDALQEAVEQSQTIASAAAAGNIEAGPEQLLPTVTINDLRSQTALMTGPDITDDLQIEILFTLSSPQTINWISVVPNNFEETTWLEVTDISIAGGDNDAFTTISGFNNDIFDNTLTDTANAELNEEEQASVLAPDRYQYRGVGVWSFDAVTAKVIKIRIKQKTAVPDPYQRLAVRLHRVMQQTYTMSSADTSMM